MTTLNDNATWILYIPRLSSATESYEMNEMQIAVNTFSLLEFALHYSIDIFLIQSDRVAVGLVTCQLASNAIRHVFFSHRVDLVFTYRRT